MLQQTLLLLIHQASLSLFLSVFIDGRFEHNCCTVSGRGNETKNRAEVTKPRF